VNIFHLLAKFLTSSVQLALRQETSPTDRLRGAAGRLTGQF